jgi:hypothetical protein
LREVFFDPAQRKDPLNFKSCPELYQRYSVFLFNQTLLCVLNHAEETLLDDMDVLGHWLAHVKGKDEVTSPMFEFPEH